MIALASTLLADGCTEPCVGVLAGPDAALRLLQAFVAQSPPAAPSTSPLAPAWLVLPMAVITLLVLAAHMHAMHAPTTPVPRARRTIRSINAGLMLVTVPVLAYAFGIATPAKAHAFALAWTGAIVMLCLVILVALADVFNTWRMHASERAQLRDQIRGLRSALHRELERRKSAPESTSGGGPSQEPPPTRDGSE